MDTTLQNKIVLGSTYKALQKAKMYGSLCLMDVSFLKIVLELKNYCQLNHSFEQEQCLAKMARDLQNKSKDICKYKNKNFNDKKFIN